MANQYLPLTFGGGQDAGTVKSVSVTPGTGVSASVTNPTTTPDISIDLIPGDISGIVGQNVLSYDPVNGISTDTVVLDTALNNLYNFAINNNQTFEANSIAVTNVNISNPGTDTFDGVTLTNGQTLFITNQYQTNPVECGLYVFNGSGVALTRFVGMNTWEEIAGSQVAVPATTTFTEGSLWRSTVGSTGTIGVTPITFAQLPGGIYVGGTGVNVTGSTISIGQSVATSASPTFVTVNAALNGNASTATALQTARNIYGNIFNGTADVTGTIAVGFGGTGINSYTTNDILYASGTTTLSKLSAATGVLYYNGSVLAYNTAPALTGTNFSGIPNSATTATSFGTPNTIVARDSSGNFTANVILADLNGNASSADVASSIATTATTTNASFYPVVVSNNIGGTQFANIISGINFNPNTNTITATTFAGTLSGNASTATTAANATNVATTSTTTNASFFPLFVASSANSNQAVNLDASGFTYNPNTNTLTATTFAGNATTATTATTATNANNINTSVVTGTSDYYLFCGLNSTAGNQTSYVLPAIYYSTLLSSLWNTGNYTSTQNIAGNINYGLIAGNPNTTANTGAGISLRSGFPGNNYKVDITQNIGASQNNCSINVTRFNTTTSDLVYNIGNTAAGAITHTFNGTAILPSNTNQIVLGTTNTTTVTMAALTGNRIFTLPNSNSNSVIGTTAIANQFVTNITTGGVQTRAQPTFSNLSGTIANTQFNSIIQTFTPTVGDDLGNNFTMFSANGYYIQLGNRLAFVFIDAAWSSKGSATGVLAVSLPLNRSTTVNFYSFTIGVMDGINIVAAGLNNLVAYTDGGTVPIKFAGINNSGGNSFLSTTNCNNFGSIKLQGVVVLA